VGVEVDTDASGGELADTAQALTNSISTSNDMRYRIEITEVRRELHIGYDERANGRHQPFAQRSGANRLHAGVSRRYGLRQTLLV